MRHVIETLGNSNIARVCGVDKSTVAAWKRKGHLPTRRGVLDRNGVVYEKKIAKLAGISVPELRKWVAEGEEEQATA